MSLGKENFASTEVHERQVVLADGKEHALWFRELPNVVLRRWALQRQADDVEVVAAADALLVSESLCEPGGERSLTFEQACGIKNAVLDRLARAALDVNGMSPEQIAQEAAGKPSPPEPSDGSGTL